MDALAEHGKGGVGKEKNAPGAGAERIHHEFAILALGQQDGSDSRVRDSQPPQEAEICEAASSEQDHVDGIYLQKVVQGGRLQGDRRNLKVPAAFESAGQELRLNETRVGNEYLHRFGSFGIAQQGGL
jgi:hypothetical protein